MHRPECQMHNDRPREIPTRAAVSVVDFGPTCADYEFRTNTGTNNNAVSGLV